MRHLKSGRKLGRKASHRKATLSALSAALIKNEKITTTAEKAKELRSFVEPLITRAKNDTNFNRARVFRYLRDKEAITKLFDEIGPMVESRPGGYTRVIKTGFRSGDGAEMALIELVDYNDVPPETGSKKKKTRRGGRRRGSGKGKAAASSPAADETKQAETEETQSSQKAGTKKQEASESSNKDDAEKKKSSSAKGEPTSQKSDSESTKESGTADETKTSEDNTENKEQDQSSSDTEKKDDK